MKIISLNLHCHKEENEAEKLARIASYIKKNDIDVCLFQEVCQTKSEMPLMGNLKRDNNGFRLSMLTGYHFYFKDFKLGFGIYEEGLGVLSKEPITDLKLINLTHTESYLDWYRRCALSFTYGGIHFLDVHLGWSLEGEPYMNQLEKLFKEITPYTVLAGDFNYPDLSPEIEEIKKHLSSSHEDAMMDPVLNPTFHNPLDSKLPYTNRMIDFIFHTKDILVHDFKIDLNKEDEYVSDHSLLYAEIGKKA